MGKIFGTDGIRGRAGTGWLTEDSVAWLGWAAGMVLGREAKNSAKRALIGHDGRRSGPGLEAAFARGLRAQGFEVKSAGLITTPGLAWLTRNHDFALGAMISASHNPSEDNGIKLFSDQGEKLSDALQDEIEVLLQAERSEIPTSEGTVHDGEFEMLYLNHLLEKGAKDLSLDGVSIVLDCANGAGSRVAPRVLGRLGAQVHSIASEPDGDNINRECGSTHPEALQRAVLSNQAHIGIALDGDGDRCILVDERGQIVHGDGIMTVIGRQAMNKGELSDARIVATVMSNRGLHRALREVGVGVVEVGVGDRQVVEKMRSEKLGLGGEQSGHIVLGDENDFIGDGVFTALRVLSVMRETGSSLSELAAPYRPMPQVLINVPVSRKPSLTELPEVLEEVRQIEAELGEDGRVLLRYSGTEDLARVMIEGLDAEKIHAQATKLAANLQAAIG